MAIDKEGQLLRIDYGDRIYFDSGIGIAGTAYPIGTAFMPSGVIANLITICVARNTRNIQVHGALTLGAAMEHYNFFDFEHYDVGSILDLNGKNVGGSHMEKLVVTGAQGTGLLTMVDCVANALTLFAGRMHFCAFYTSTCSFKDLSYIDLVDCESIYGPVIITVQAPGRASIKNWRGNLVLNAQDGGFCNVRGFKGYLEIDDMSLGTLNIFANGADIQINADCDGGIINIFGNARVTDDSAAACMVNDYSSSGYKELSATGATTGAAYINALDIDARLYNEFTIKLKNTDVANSLDYRVLLRPEYGVAEEMIQPEDQALAFGDYDFVNIDHKWGQAIVQVRDTVADSHADFEVYAICNKQ